MPHAPRGQRGAVVFALLGVAVVHARLAAIAAAIASGGFDGRQRAGIVGAISRGHGSRQERNGTSIALSGMGADTGALKRMAVEHCHAAPSTAAKATYIKAQLDVLGAGQRSRRRAAGCAVARSAVTPNQPRRAASCAPSISPIHWPQRLQGVAEGYQHVHVYNPHRGGTRLALGCRDAGRRGFRHADNNTSRGQPAAGVMANSDTLAPRGRSRPPRTNARHRLRPTSPTTTTGTRLRHLSMTRRVRRPMAAPR